MTQRVGVCIDNMGTLGETPDQEREEILEDLGRLGLEPVLVFYGHDPMAIPFERQMDLLVVDYGIISIQGGADDWTRRLLQWADEHPGSVLLIWSSMTADGFVFELRDSLERQLGGQLELDDDREWTPPWPANVRAYHTGNAWYAKWGDGDGVDWLRSSDEYLRSWFGVTKRTALEEEVEAAGPLEPPSDWSLEPPSDWPDEDPIAPALDLESAQPRRALVEAPLEALELGVRAHEPERFHRKGYRMCPRCLREESAGGVYDHARCAPCGEYVGECACDPIDMAPHPTVGGRRLQIGDRVRVKDRSAENRPGGPTRDGVVTGMRFVYWYEPDGEVWIEVGSSSEIFREEDLEPWSAEATS